MPAKVQLSDSDRQAIRSALAKASPGRNLEQVEQRLAQRYGLSAAQIRAFKAHVTMARKKNHDDAVRAAATNQNREPGVSEIEEISPGIYKVVETTIVRTPSGEDLSAWLDGEDNSVDVIVDRETQLYRYNVSIAPVAVIRDEADHDS